MIFNSINYFLFLLVVFIVYYLLPDRLRWIILLVASVCFYLIGGNAITLIVPAVIIVSTYCSGILIEKTEAPGKKKAYYLSGLLINVGLLAFFKYINFFIITAVQGVTLFRSLFGTVSYKMQPALITNLIVPLGISYITFQAIGYLIEVNRGNGKAEKNIGLFATYLMFFPKLFSGPIEPSQMFLPQLKQPNKFDYTQVVTGLKRILWGLFLKLVVANRLAIYTDAVFYNYIHHSGGTILLASIFFTIQLFADFAGYTDMAIGSAQILGYKLIENFNTPFVAKSVTEFWRRWHISLSSWVNEYIYNPIVFTYRNWNKAGVVFAGMVTFIILGFWHGPSWNYIFFGFLQGLILAIEFLTRKLRKRIRGKIPVLLNNTLGIAFTFGYFTFASIFFKASNLSDGMHLVKRIFTKGGPIYYENPSMILFSILGVLMVLAVEIKKANYNDRFSLFNNKNWLVRNFAYIAVIMLILIMGVFDGGQFIYFKF